MKTKTKSTQKIKWATVEFNYTPPTETEQRIAKIERCLKVVQSLLVYLEGMNAGGGSVYKVVSQETPSVLREIISANERRLLELKEDKKPAKK